MLLEGHRACVLENDYAVGDLHLDMSLHGCSSDQDCPVHVPQIIVKVSIICHCIRLMPKNIP
jgi:hypothetical protein